MNKYTPDGNGIVEISGIEYDMDKKYDLDYSLGSFETSDFGAENLDRYIGQLQDLKEFVENNAATLSFMISPVDAENEQAIEVNSDDFPTIDFSGLMVDENLTFKDSRGGPEGIQRLSYFLEESVEHIGEENLSSDLIRFVNDYTNLNLVDKTKSVATENETAKNVNPEFDKVKSRIDAITKMQDSAKEKIEEQRESKKLSR